MECWSARELYTILGYAKWQTFENVLEKAREACRQAGVEPSDHFTGASKMVGIGSGSERNIDDIMLTRYGCYLVAQNGDPRKPEIAFAQNYFAVQTRVADFLPTLGIKAKDFAAEMTSVNVQQKDLHGMNSIEREHVDNNLAVRKMLLERGIVPENLPAGEDVKIVERRLAAEEKKMVPKRKKD